jgi:chromosome segregation ATPase
VDEMRRSIEEASRAAETAKADLASLRDAVQLQTQGLMEASKEANRSAEAIKLSLGREREQLFDLASSLDKQSTGVTEAVGRQARMVADASDLAQTQIREAEARWRPAQPTWPRPPPKRATPRAPRATTWAGRCCAWRAPARACRTSSAPWSRA